jgi:spermidine/putrescine transport system permease protein
MSEIALTPTDVARLRWSRLQGAVVGCFPLVMTIGAYLFLFVPLLVLIVYSFNASRSTVVWSGFTIDWYAQVFEDSRLRKALWNSAIIAVVSATTSTAIGTVTALAIVRRDFPGRDALSTLLMAPLVLPEIVVAVAFLVFMVVINVKLGFFTLIVGHILVALPFTILIVRAAASALDRRLEEAAADLGANEVQVFLRVTMPLLMPAVFTAFLMAATLSFDNFVMSTFTTGVGTTTLPLYIYSLLKLGITPKINAMGTLLVLVNVLLVIIVLGRQLRLVLKR